MVGLASQLDLFAYIGLFWQFFKFFQLDKIYYNLAAKFPFYTYICI